MSAERLILHMLLDVPVYARKILMAVVSPSRSLAEEEKKKRSSGTGRRFYQSQNADDCTLRQ